MEIKVDVLKQGLRDYFDPNGDFASDFAELKEGNIIDKLIVIGGFIAEAITVVEKLARDLGGLQAGAAKKEAVVEWIDEILDLPWWAEALDGKFASILIDVLVGWYNRKVGNDWLRIFGG